MPDNRKDLENDPIEQAFLESLNRLNKAGSEKKKEPSPDPVDAHRYQDPEKRSPEVYDKMVSEIERKRAQRSKSIWSDEPANPVKKSIWLDDDTPKATREPRQPAGEQPRANKKTIELKLSESMRKKMGDQTEAADQERLRPADEAPRRVRQRPAEDTADRTRQFTPEEASGRRRQRPAEEMQDRTRQFTPEETSSRVRQRPAEETSSRVRQRPAEETSSRVRQRPAEEVPGRTRQRTADEAAQRPRKRRRKPKFKTFETEFSFINAALCIIMVFGVGISLIAVKRASGKIESENRMMASFPDFSLGSYFKGEYTEGIVKYYTDTIPSREDLKSFSTSFSKLFGINISDVEHHGNTQAAKKEEIDKDKIATATKATLYTGTRETEPTPPETAPPQSGGEPVETKETPRETAATIQRVEVPDEGEWAGNVIISGKGTPSVRALPLFFGTEWIGQSFAEVLNKYKQMVGPTVNVYSMGVPLASAYYMPTNLKDEYSDQHEYIQVVNAALNGVIGVDVYDALLAHANEYIYSRTDHHWQPLGAYYAAQKFAEEANVPFADISTYEKCKIDDFCGTMYTFSDYEPSLKQYPDTFWYYKPQNEYTCVYHNEAFNAINDQKQERLFFDGWFSGAGCYSTILGGDLDIAEIKTDVHNGRTLVVIKDSYGNALIPFLTQSFEKIYVVDFRYAEIAMKDLFRLVGATDILFGMSISSNYTQSHIAAIEEIMQ